MNENPPVFSAGFCRNKGLCILRIEGNTAVIGYVKRIPYEDEQRIERYCSRSGYKTEYESCQPEELKIRITRLYSGSAELKTSEAEKNEGCYGYTYFSEQGRQPCQIQKRRKAVPDV